MALRLAEDWEAHDAFLRRRDTALIYSSSKYLRFLKEALPGADLRVWHDFRAGRIYGVLPVVARPSPWGTVLNSLPYYGSHGGITADDGESHDALAQCFVGQAREKGILSATLIESPFTANDPVRYGADCGDSRIGQIRALDGVTDRDALLSSFHKKTRYAVRRAERGSLTVEVENTPAAWEFLLTEHGENMIRLGGIPKSPPEMDALRRHLQPGEDYDLYVAFAPDGVRVAALLLLYFHRTVEYYIPATRSEHLADQPMSLLVCESMMRAVGRGFRHWNFGGTRVNQEGVHRFKRRWGAADRIYRYHVFLSPDREAELREIGRREISERIRHFYVVPFGRWDPPRDAAAAKVSSVPRTIPNPLDPS